MTIALVYNLKKEAALLSAPRVDASSALSINSPFALAGATGVVTAPVASAPRVNDEFAEWDTMETVGAVRDAIALRHRVELIEADEDAYPKLRALAPAMVFNIAEGLHGVSREAQIPAMLELLGIPYLGSDPLTLALCLDKARAKEILAYHRIPTAPFVVVSTLEELAGMHVRFPAMVKPLHEGSSKGIYNSCVVRTPAELAQEVTTICNVYSEPALIEEFLPGREFTVAIMGNGTTLEILPIVEIRFDALPAGMNHIYSYEAKWILDTTENPLDIFTCPAPLDPQLKSEIESICAKTYTTLRCRDWSRIDLRLDAKGRPQVIEINPLPGILPRPEDNSCFPKAARAAGMDYNNMINRVLDIALMRVGLSPDGRGS